MALRRCPDCGLPFDAMIEFACSSCGLSIEDLESAEEFTTRVEQREFALLPSNEGLKREPTGDR